MRGIDSLQICIVINLAIDIRAIKQCRHIGCNIYVKMNKRFCEIVPLLLYNRAIIYSQPISTAILLH